MISFEVQGIAGTTYYAEYQDNNFLYRSFRTDEILSQEAAYQKLSDPIDAGFRRISVHLEDTILVFPHADGDKVPYEFENGVAGCYANGVFCPMYRHVAAFDVLTGTSHHGTMKNEEIKAVLKLAFLSDEIPDAVEMYKIAEAAIVGWPNEIRPIP